jgi:hypothetical protein
VVNPVAYDYLFQEELYYFSSRVAIILSKPWETYTDDEQSLLRKILSSVKVDLNAVQMLTRRSVDLESLKIFSPARVLVFGSDIQKDNVPLYQATAAQGFTVIRADDLTALDDQKKKNLWAALRQMFG